MEMHRVPGLRLSHRCLPERSHLAHPHALSSNSFKTLQKQSPGMRNTEEGRRHGSKGFYFLNIPRSSNWPFYSHWLVQEVEVVTYMHRAACSHLPFVPRRLRASRELAVMHSLGFGSHSKAVCKESDIRHTPGQNQNGAPPLHIPSQPAEFQEGPFS